MTSLIMSAKPDLLHKPFSDLSNEPSRKRKRECSDSSSSGLTRGVMWAEFQQFMTFILLVVTPHPRLIPILKGVVAPVLQPVVPGLLPFPTQLITCSIVPACFTCPIIPACVTCPLNTAQAGSPACLALPTSTARSARPA